MKGFMCCASERNSHEAIGQAHPLQSPGKELTALLQLMWAVTRLSNLALRCVRCGFGYALKPVLNGKCLSVPSEGRENFMSLGITGGD